MIKKFLRKISAERTDLKKSALLPTFYQHQKAYSFCKKFIRNKTIIEVGCGSGSGSYMLSSYAKSVISIDNDEETIKENIKKYKKNNLNFRCLDIRYLKKNQFKNKVDVVLSLQVIEHLSKPKDLLKRIKLILKKDGLLVLSTPNKQTQSYNENPYHYVEYSKKELFLLLSQYFKVVEIYGLYGDSLVNKYEKQRKTNALRILSIDALNIRKFLPIKTKRFFFDIATFLNRTIIGNKNDSSSSISEQNYKIVKRFDESIDLIAVCKKYR